MTARPWQAVSAALVLLMAGTASAAYFHERADALHLSDRALKMRFQLSAVPTVAALSTSDAAAIVAAAAAVGLFEEEGGLRVPIDRCGETGPKARACQLEWEAKHLTGANGVATRKAATLALKSKAGPVLTLRDWNKCAPKGECDGERFTYLGPLGRSVYHAVEIGYGHDAPSLVLFHAGSGKLASVHYGSEPTFLNRPGTLLVNSEDLNDASSLLVTSLRGDAPALDLQCLGARTPEAAFGITFKRWVSDATFDIVLAEKRRGSDTSEQIAVQLARADNGAWTIASPIDLKAHGFECRARTAQ